MAKATRYKLYGMAGTGAIRAGVGYAKGRLKSRDINKMIKSLEAKGSRISSKDKEKLSNLKFLRDYHMGRGKARKLGKGLAAVGVTALGLGAEIAGKRYLSRSLRRRGSLR